MGENSIFTPEEFKKLKPSKGVKRRKKEEQIQLAFCAYVKYKYPDIIFSCDIASGMKFPIHVAARNKKMRSSRSQLDFFAAEPALVYKGFFLELKQDADEVYLKDGVTFKKKKVQIKVGSKVIEEYDHIEEQWKMILKLRSKGYYADFGLGYEDCVKKFNSYISSGIPL